MKRLLLAVIIGTLSYSVAPIANAESPKYKLSCHGRSLASDGQYVEFDLVDTSSSSDKVVDGKICRSTREIASADVVHPVCPPGTRLQVDYNHGTYVDRCWQNHLITRNAECPGGKMIIHQAGRDTCLAGKFVFKAPKILRQKKIVKYEYIDGDWEDANK